MKEVKIEVDSDICEYCEYFRSEPNKCVQCDSQNNFRGIECIKLTDEKEKNIELQELVEETITELISLTKDELIAFIVENEITSGIKEYVTMRAEINARKEKQKNG